MSLASLVIWLENAKSFMRVIIRVIYRITPSYLQLHKSLLCSAGAAEVERKQFLCIKNIPLCLDQFANSPEFLPLQQKRLQLAQLA